LKTIQIKQDALYKLHTVRMVVLAEKTDAKLHERKFIRNCWLKGISSKLNVTCSICFWYISCQLQWQLLRC